MGVIGTNHGRRQASISDGILVYSMKNFLPPTLFYVKIIQPYCLARFSPQQDVITMHTEENV